jgi:hypothetical protein
MKRHYPLNIMTPLFKDGVNPFEFSKTQHTRISLVTLNPDILKIFFSLGLEIMLVEVFYSYPMFSCVIHIDGAGGDINKINWVYGGQQCAMNWFSIKPGIVKEPSKTSINTSYISFKPDEVELEDTTVLHSPSIINAGVPHNICNSFEDRWCVSVVYRFKHNKIRPTMKQTLELFKEYIK